MSEYYAQYHVGDVVNGHRLNEYGQWVPVAVPKKSNKGLAFAIVGGLFAFLLVGGIVASVPAVSSLSSGGGGNVAVGVEECYVAWDEFDYYLGEAGYALEVYDDYAAADNLEYAADAIESCTTMSGPDGITEAAGYVGVTQEHLYNSADALRGGDYDSASYELDAAFVALDQATVALDGSSAGTSTDV